MLRVKDHSSLQFGTGDFSIVLVARWRNSPQVPSNTSYGCLIGKTEAVVPYKGFALFANYPSGYEGVPALPRFAAQLDLGDQLLLSSSNYLNDDQWRVYVARRVGLDLELRINGINDGKLKTKADWDISAPESPLTIGGGDGQELSGAIAEIAVIKGPLSDAQLEGVERSLIVKYDLM